MYNIVTFLLSQSIYIPLLIGLIRIRQLNSSYYPFMALLIAGVLSELISSILIEYYHKGNAADIKIYSLLECMLVLYQFYRWRKNVKFRPMFLLLSAACIVFWLVEVVIFHNINTFSPFFRVFYAFIIVLLSINQINAMMFDHDGPLFKNPRFLVCMGFIIFFLYQILYEASYYIGSDQSALQFEVASKIIIGFGYINFIINLLYAIALFFISDKKDEYNYYFNGQ